MTTSSAAGDPIWPNGYPSLPEQRAAEERAAQDAAQREVDRALDAQLREHETGKAAEAAQRDTDRVRDAQQSAAYDADRGNGAGPTAADGPRSFGDQAALGSRCFDGSPETPADSRFFDLRESGYTGWINQDGYAADDDGAPLALPAAGDVDQAADDDTDGA